MPEKMLLSEVVRAAQRIFYFELVHDRYDIWTSGDLLARLGDRASSFLATKALEKLVSDRHMQRAPRQNALPDAAITRSENAFEFTSAGFAQAEVDYRNDLSAKGINFDGLYETFVEPRFRRIIASGTITDNDDRAEGAGTFEDPAPSAGTAFTPVSSSGLNPNTVFAADAAEATIIPASDRFVTLDHNAPAYADAVAKIAELTQAVRGANDLFANADDRLAVLSEIEGIGAMLRQKVVRVGAVAQLARQEGTLAYLAAKTGVIGNAAYDLIKFFLGFIGQ